MKKIIVLMISFTIILGLCGCNNQDKTIGRKSEINITKEKVSLIIKEKTLTSTGATVILKNDSDDDVHYGTPYHLEKKVNNEWYILKPIEDLNFIMPLFILKPEESSENNIDWNYGYRKLPKGTYRIVKDTDIVKNDESKEKIFIAAEFVIN